MKIPEILLVESLHKPGSLARVLTVIGDEGLVIEHLNAVRRDGEKTVWEITLELDMDDARGLIEKIDALPNARVLGKSDRVFNRHEGGKVRMTSRLPIATLQELRDIYTPGVARVCLAIRDEPALARRYTGVAHTVGIITNGTAILGLGDIGPLAGLPVMEGKAALMARMADLSGIPVLIDEKDPGRLVEAIAAVAPSFGAIQLEDIAAPACFAVEDALRARLDIPVLHDDQHGTAVVILAALISAARRVGLDIQKSVIGQIGLGAAGIGIARLLKAFGARSVLGTDLNEDAMRRLESMGGTRTDLAGLMAQADVVIATTGKKGLIDPALVRPGQLVFALSNPDPEIEPEDAMERGAAFAADGKSINNVLGFPGLFRGALDARARAFTDGMLFAAARAISDAAPEGELVPSPLDRAMHDAVALAVCQAAGGKKT
ncbi:MAG: NAD-dependent malic enzyme [Spirochaetes bacterium]|nr:MAG: NAD-dependent malic enzyme [Spirochaetota bacterium]